MKLTSRVMFIGAAVAAFLISFNGVAFAQAVADPGGDVITGLIQSLWGAISGGQYLYACAIALSVSVALLRKFGGDTWPVLHTDQGAALMLLLGSFGAALTVSLAGNAIPTPEMFWHAAEVAFGAAGGYAMFKSLVVVPYLIPLRDTATGIVRKLLDAVVFLFEHVSIPAPEKPSV